MLQSMFSGISGLRTHQRKMDVIGNNIANVNTTGFKGSDVTFKEAYVATIRAPAPGTPGQQVGLGSQIGGITRNFKGGILMETGQTANMGVSGNGFFVLADVGAPVGVAAAYYSRAGDFVLDVQTVGAVTTTYLINPDGKRLRGLNSDTDLTGLDGSTFEDIELPAGTTSFSIGLDGTVYSMVGGVSTACAKVPLATFDNNSGLDSIGSNLFMSTAAAGPRDYNNAGESGTGQIFQGYLENSNVDLAQEFTNMIITQRGFQANSRTITTSDEMLQDLLSLKR